MYKLWLDDIRDPKEWIEDYNSDVWKWCKTMNEAVVTVTKYGFPCFISFDHDLGLNEESGMVFANWLVDQDLMWQNMPRDFDFAVHSANPCGADNIRGLMNGYLKFKRENPRE